MHKVAVLALQGVVNFDLAIPCEVFGRARQANGAAVYDILLCGEAQTVKAGWLDLVLPWGLERLADADTVIVPGVHRPIGPPSAEVLRALRAAAGRGARLASICSGAFVLAAAGLLDGLRATTHWLATAQLAGSYPKVRVEPNVLFVDNGQVLCSAGAAAGLDLCLHMVRRDCGAAVAADVAKLSVMPLERAGGQAQFIVHQPPSTRASLQPLIEWMGERCHQPLTLEDVAAQAHLSVRTLSRRFKEQTGTTPLQWLLLARIRRAQALLEQTALSVEEISAQAGFSSAGALRQRFSAVMGTSPSGYRRAFGYGGSDGGEGSPRLS
ncbi:GlxA family transcriptional regulator [Azohydromonas lata]|uniref:Helix-turn-helix domain-containing protein n=1 Tax=Azohydromonas lata TaxID=45677 RepID=A0ABU5IMJ6_9BURK|nr:helix-turn-helix domain-containing protein [Azohydromonas lata]MDZ5460079.1 helix-turn-helix domain-containing protein [Azohydromonas lata]